MQELNRVLPPGGWMVIQVPVSDEPTFEDDTITDPKDRQFHFGQVDHVRRYGLDLKDRLTESGFSVSVLTITDLVNQDEAAQLSIPADEYLFFCLKK
jgi:hypothetical protein